MSRPCPQCGAPPAKIDLPVCPRCGARRPAAEVAGTGAAPEAGAASEAGAAPEAGAAQEATGAAKTEAAPHAPQASAAELAQRYFTPPVRFTPSALGFLVELAAPYLIPAATYALTLTTSGETTPSWRWLRWVTAALAVVVCLAVAALRRPGRLAIVLDARGVRAGGRRRPWSDLLAVRLRHNPRGTRIEQLQLLWRDRSSTIIVRQLAATARLSSLSNLAELLEELLEAGRAQPRGSGSA